MARPRVRQRRSFGSIQKIGNTYYIRYGHAGRRFKRAVGPSRVLAAQKLAQIELAIAQEVNLGIRTVPAVTFAGFQPILNPLLRARHKASTLTSDEHRYRQIIAYFGEKPLRELDVAAVEDFRAHLVSTRGCAVATVNRYLAFLSVVMREAVLRGFARTNPVREIKRAREELPVVPFLARTDIDRILARAKPEYRCPLLVLVETGLRRGELVALEWRDVDLANGRVTVRHSKSGRGRIVPMTPAVRQTLEALSDDRGPTPLNRQHYVYPDLQGNGAGRLSAALKRAARLAGFPDLHLHDLRHVFASSLAHAGVPISTIGQLLGHSPSSLSVTLRYARHAPDGADVAAVNKLVSSWTRAETVRERRAT